MLNTSLLAIHNLSSILSNGQPLHHQLNLTLQAGQSLALLGPSGAGKSSLLKLIMNGATSNLKITQGRLELKGQNLIGLPVKKIRDLQRSTVAYVDQHSINSLNPALTMKQHFNILLKNDSFISAILEPLQLDKADLQRYPFQLSGGMASRFALAIALSQAPQLLLADEITAHLDQQTASALLHLLNLYQQKGLSLIVVTHDLDKARQLSHHYLIMEKGSIIERSTFTHS